MKKNLLEKVDKIDLQVLEINHQEMERKKSFGFKGKSSFRDSRPCKRWREEKVLGLRERSSFRDKPSRDGEKKSFASLDGERSSFRDKPSRDGEKKSFGFKGKSSFRDSRPCKRWREEKVLGLRERSSFNKKEINQSQIVLQIIQSIFVQKTLRTNTPSDYRRKKVF